jgi:integrase
MTTTKVRLTQYTTTKHGKVYRYWLLRWYDGRGTRHSKNIGRADGKGGLSRRQAELERSRQEERINASRIAREVIRIPTLGEFLTRYLTVRKAEVAPGTLELHERTGTYLKEFFGKDVRLDEITKATARDFMAALADNKLTTKVKPSACTVNQHLRNARRMFALAVDDELLLANPFDRLARANPPSKAWHEVTDEEFSQMMAAARPDWRILLGLARWAGLRRGEALDLRWDQVDWDHHRLTVIANEEWQPKDKDKRVVPIVPELYALLLAAFQEAAEGQKKLVPGTINARNIDRDFKVLCRRSGVVPWKKPMHTLRKTCLTRWAKEHPQHVVKEWAGHGDERTTSQYYLKVSEREYDAAAGLSQGVTLGNRSTLGTGV